jgi:hypothetical protein
MKRIAALALVFVLVSQWGAFAHEAGEHHKSHGPDPRMLVLHKIMPDFAQSQARINEALKIGDKAAVEAETKRILENIPDLKKARPHKNLGKLPVMRQIATAFEKDVRATADLAKKGAFAEAEKAFAMAQKKCTECHAKFRD